MAKKPAPKKKRTAAPKAAKAPKPKGTAIAVAKLKEQAKRGAKERIFTQEDLDTLIECALLGYTNEQIADELGVGHTKFYEWKAEIAEIPEALTRARRNTNARVAKAILARAEGGMVKETQAIKVKVAGGGEDVKVVETERYIPPDTAAGVYWLNNRSREQWKVYKQYEHSGPGGGPIQHQEVIPEAVMAYLDKLMEAIK